MRLELRKKAKRWAGTRYLVNLNACDSADAQYDNADAGQLRKSVDTANRRASDRSIRALTIQSGTIIGSIIVEFPCLLFYRRA
jgi:hypothetical protein